MAGQSGHNLKIARSRLGCRLPFESSAVGNGYALSGPCESRKMTEAERTRYGPAIPRGEYDRMDARICQACKTSKNVEEAAELLNISVVNLKRRIGVMGIKPRWAKKQEGAETVEEIQVYDNPVLPDTTGQVAQEAKRKTRLEIAREKLAPEEYQRLREQGLSEKKIYTQFGIAPDTFYRLKREWGSVEGKAAPTAPTEKPELAAEPVTKVADSVTNQPKNDHKPPEIVPKAAETDQDDDIDWAKPFKTVGRVPAFRLSDKGLSFNSFALASMIGVKHLKIGVSKAGIVVVMPATGPEDAYTIGRNSKREEKSCSAKVGGGTLVRFLESRGIKQGRYLMIKNGDRWEGRAEGGQS